MYRSHWNRIINNPIKWSIMLLMLFIPIMEVIQLYFQLKDFGNLEKPVCALFYLSGAGRGHMFQVIGLWLLPLYLLLIVSDDSCVDQKIGYKYVLISRVGKKLYLIEKWVSSFFFSFILMSVSLVLNMLLIYLVFFNRCSNQYLRDYMTGTTFEAFNCKYPLLSYIIYIIVASVICGMLGSFGSIISSTFRDRRYVYAIVFLMWLIFIVMDDSIMLVFQPYNEYPVVTIVRSTIKFLTVYILGGLGAVIYEKRRSVE